MNPRKDWLRLVLHVGVYVILYLVAVWVFGPLLVWISDSLALLTLAGLGAAVFTNWLTLRIYENRRTVELGLRWNRASADNFGWGILGGAGAACIVLGPPLLIGLSRLIPSQGDHPSAGASIFVGMLLVGGSIGEELFFRGYGFQLMVASLGPWTTVIPVGVIFALLHGDNPNATWFGIANTAGFGILFGYAFLRSRDLWLPIGLHLGWNFTLPLFGVNVSGFRMKVTGYEMVWNVGKLFSGGDYGPEASVLTTGVILLLAMYLWKVPIRRQPSPLTDPPAEIIECEPAPPLRS
jgi:membrane protease YdiL (CAAX protease family)